MTATTLPDETLAGYRLVRRLASGSRAQVYLGVGSTGSVALKVFERATPRESVGAELDALGRLESAHLVRLLDVVTDSDVTPILVLERLSQRSIADLLTDRDWIECGEVVTLLAPLASLVAELHEAGVAHGKLRTASVHLGSEGAPVLLGLGHCDLFEPRGTMAALDAEPAAVADRAALAAMALGLLERVRHGRGNRVGDLVRWIEETPKRYEFPGELAERLFASAEPMAIAVPAAGERMIASAIPASNVPAFTVPVFGVPASGVPARVATDGRAGGSAAEPTPSEKPLPGWVPAWVPELMLGDPAEAVKRRVMSFVRGVRPRFWVIAGAAVVGLIVALSLVPSGSPAPVGVGVGESTVAATARAAIPSSSPTLAAGSPVPGSLVTGKPMPDDPVLAAAVLLKARVTCFRSLSVLCLDSVDEESSAAFQTDAALIQSVEGGAELPKTAAAASSPLGLVERLGDSALISLGSSATPPTILVIRTKSGWRIRDYLTGAQVTTTPQATGQ